jgi:peptidoglycan/xylan/chitin deacetylase (PgdA/CDA1 family)
MHRYFIRVPPPVRWLFPQYLWRMPADGRKVYLTFDDGPHPEITPWVLRQLAAFGAKATFFCIGKNVALFPDVYAELINAGHAVGNHTLNHLNGWKVPTEAYVADAVAAQTYISSSLFRPPYGRIRRGQAKGIKKAMGPDVKIVMWDVLSGDFDASFSPQRCLQNVLNNIKPGSVVVFHDSEKAAKNMKAALPQVLAYCKEKAYVCAAL